MITTKIYSIGDTPPSFELANSQSEMMNLKKIAENKRIILVFYRGWWWPFCRSQLAAFKQYHNNILNWNAHLLGVSVDSIAENKKLRMDLELPFEILSDENRQLINAWNIINKWERGGIPYPNLYILNEQTKIIFHSPDRLASRVDLSIILQFMKNYKNNPDYQFFNTTRKLQLASFWDLLMVVPRRLIKKNKQVK